MKMLQTKKALLTYLFSSFSVSGISVCRCLQLKHNIKKTLSRIFRIFSKYFQKRILFGVTKIFAKIVRIMGLVLEKNVIDL